MNDRNQVANRTRMESTPAQHEGLGVSHYAWSSSPIRRYVDLTNQRQLIAALTVGTTAAKDVLNETIRDFETAYEAYNDFQRQMERYWCLVYMQQEQALEQPATLIRDDLVRFADLPLVTRCAGIPGLPAGTPGRSSTLTTRSWRSSSLPVRLAMRRHTTDHPGLPRKSSDPFGGECHIPRPGLAHRRRGGHVH